MVPFREVCISSPAQQLSDSKYKTLRSACEVYAVRKSTAYSPSTSRALLKVNHHHCLQQSGTKGTLVDTE